MYHPHTVIWYATGREQQVLKYTWTDWFGAHVWRSQQIIFAEWRYVTGTLLACVGAAVLAYYLVGLVP